MTRWVWKVVHNCIIHPMIPFFPFPIVGQLHDWTADRAFGPKENPNA